VIRLERMEQSDTTAFILLISIIREMKSSWIRYAGPVTRAGTFDGDIVWSEDLKGMYSLDDVGIDWRSTLKCSL
jgi:hypothetical protein